MAVKISIFSFLTGLAIYQGFTWTRDLDTTAGQQDNRNVFITFLVGTGACISLFVVVFTAKNIESILRRGYRVSSDPSIQQEEAFRGMEQLETTGTDPSTPPIPMAEYSLPQDMADVRPRYVADRIVSGDLAAALNAAAQAHLHCARADRKVAFEYARMAMNVN